LIRTDNVTELLGWYSILHHGDGWRFPRATKDVLGCNHGKREPEVSSAQNGQVEGWHSDEVADNADP